MDPSRVDSLAKLVGSGQSRRRILKTLAGGALASVGAALGLDRADAAKLRSVGNSCNVNGDCASGLCVQERPGRKICHCRSAGDCPGGDVCHRPVCSAGTCGLSAVSCDDGNACTIDTCDPVVGCVHTALVCDDSNACTKDTCDPELGCIFTAISCDDGNACTVDSCDAQTGCAHTPVEDHTPCKTGALCTADTCQAGVCTVGDPIDCGTGEECVNHGCFTITVTDDNCSQACTPNVGYGSVDGSGNFLCGAPTGTSCSTNADCPPGSACSSGSFCIAAC